MSAYLGSILGLLLLLMVHFRAVRLLALDRSRGGLLCVISGIAVAYVFIDVLPHLARKQFGLEVLLPGIFAKYLTHHLVYLMALLGFGVYVGIRAFSAAESGPRGARYGYAAIVVSMCFYAAFIGYMLAEQPIYRPEPALLFAIAMSAHFLGLHHELQDGHLVFYNRVVRYLLMGSTALGWLGSLVYTISAPVFALSFAYIAGGIVAVAAMNDLPRVRSARGFTAFALGALVYSVLLLVIEGYKINAL
jgi:hypothetical protein